MEILIAIAHFVGMFLAIAVLVFFVLMFNAWEIERNEKKYRAIVAMELKIPINEIDNDEHIPNILKISYDRFSSELFKNRISDMLGVVRTLWYWLCNFAMLGTILYVGWLSFTEGPQMASYVWFTVLVWLFFNVVSMVFSLFCLLLTGRYPGQAKAARAEIVKHVEKLPTTD